MNRTKHHASRAVRAALAVCTSAAIALAVNATAAQAAEPPAAKLVVNINTATPEQLQALPGVGEVRALRIVAERKAKGGFKSVAELQDVRGIGPALLEKLSPHVVVSGPSKLGPAG